jgi:hypothetical protein
MGNRVCVFVTGSVARSLSGVRCGEWRQRERERERNRELSYRGQRESVRDEKKREATISDTILALLSHPPIHISPFHFFPYLRIVTIL